MSKGHDLGVLDDAGNFLRFLPAGENLFDRRYVLRIICDQKPLYREERR